MEDSPALQNLLQWLQETGTYLHPSLSVVRDTERGAGLRVVKRPNTAVIDAQDLLASIPVPALLSTKTSSLAHRASDLQHLPPNAQLAVHLLHEQCLGSRSRWAAYLKGCCAAAPCLPFTWSEEAKSWVRGTEAEHLAQQQWEGFDLVRLEEVFEQLQDDQILQDDYETPPSVHLLAHAFCLVQSRAFGCDEYHGLSMVPLADLFNHSDEPDTQLEIEEDVCLECGSPARCLHRPDKDVASAVATPATVDMRADHDLPAATDEFEVYNTYGPSHSSAELLLRYGFFSDASEFDKVHWEDTEQVTAMLDVAAPADTFMAGLLYIDSDGQISSGLAALLARLAQEQSTAKETLLQRLMAARLSSFHFHDEPVAQLLDRRDDFIRLGQEDKSLALGYLISQRQILEAAHE